VPRESVLTRPLEPAAEMRRAMIERAEAARAGLVATLERSDRSAQGRRTIFGKLKMIELRLRKMHAHDIRHPDMLARVPSPGPI
jgi:hypothetical protein